MRKALLTLCLSFIVYSLFSQEDSLLKKFKFRNIHYRSIFLSLDGGGQSNTAQLASGKNKTSSSSASTGATYYYLRSTDRILLNISGGLYTGFGFSKSKNPSDEYKSRNTNLSPYISLNNKWFSRKLFTELGIDASAYSYGSKNTQTIVPIVQKSNRNNQSVAITAGIGKGRLENITDMQNALWLNKTLEKEGSLSRSLSADELNGLGKAVTAANNTRVLDSRKRTQFILKSIDNYFQSKGLISKTDIKYFSNLNDIVFFALNQPRLSGSELFIRVTPSIINHNEKSENYQGANLKNTQDATTRSARFSSGINRYIPVNLEHQNNFGISSNLEFISHREKEKQFVSGVLTDEFDFDSDICQGTLEIFFQHMIYPNTRTALSFKLDSETGYQEVGDESGFFGVAELSTSLNYFISYRTRFNFSAAARYQNNKYSIINSYSSLEPETIQFFANAGIQVSL